MSNINPSLIDQTFPVAGTDNDSQGFRTNFSGDVTNFTYAAAEITDLQNKVILKSALTEVGTLNNNFAGALMSNATVQGFSEVILDNGTVSGSLGINFANGSFQRITPNGSVTIALNGWPTAGNLGKIRIEVVITNTAYTLTLPSAVTLGTSGILGLSGNVITFPSTGAYLYEFSSFDAGATIAIIDFFNNRTTSSGSVNAIAASSINLNITAIGSQAAAPTGSIFRLTNLDSNTTRMTIDSYLTPTSGASGVSMRTGRGTAASPSAIQSGDYMGSVSVHGFGSSMFQAASTGAIAFISEGNFTDSSQPTAISFQVTGLSVVKAEKMRLTNAGVLSISTGTNATSTSTGSLVLTGTGGIGVGGSIYVAGNVTVNGSSGLIGNITSSTVAITGGSITGTALSSHSYSTNTANVSTTYTVGAGDDALFCNVTGSGFTVTIPAAASNTGRVLRFIRTDSSSSSAVLTIVASGGNITCASASTGNGTNTITFVPPGSPVAGVHFILQSDGSNWWQVG